MSLVLSWLDDLSIVESWGGWDWFKAAYQFGQLIIDITFISFYPVDQWLIDTTFCPETLWINLPSPTHINNHISSSHTQVITFWSPPAIYPIRFPFFPLTPSPPLHNQGFIISSSCIVEHTSSYLQHTPRTISHHIYNTHREQYQLKITRDEKIDVKNLPHPHNHHPHASHYHPTTTATLAKKP